MWQADDNVHNVASSCISIVHRASRADVNCDSLQCNAVHCIPYTQNSGQKVNCIILNYRWRRAMQLSRYVFSRFLCSSICRLCRLIQSEQIVPVGFLSLLKIILINFAIVTCGSTVTLERYWFHDNVANILEFELATLYIYIRVKLKGPLLLYKEVFMP